MTNANRSVDQAMLPPRWQAAVAAEQRTRAAIARRAVSAVPMLGTDEVVAAVDAATFVRAQAHTDTDGKPDQADTEMPDRSPQRRAVEAADRTVRAAAAVMRLSMPHPMGAAIGWRPWGTVVPVLAASPGAGASVVAAALTDALLARGWRAMLADTADPVRSGLARAAASEGPHARGPHPDVRVRFSWRGGAILGRIESELPVITPGMVPSPPWWILPEKLTPQATVVDIAHDAWSIATSPTVGAGAWLRHGSPPPRPVMVCRASVPSLLAANAVLARLDTWASGGALAPVEHLVITGARKWPRGVAGVAGKQLAQLARHAVFVPHDAAVAAHGVTADALPQRVQKALDPIIDGLNLPQPPQPRAGKGGGRS